VSIPALILVAGVYLIHWEISLEVLTRTDETEGRPVVTAPKAAIVATLTLWALQGTRINQMDYMDEQFVFQKMISTVAERSSSDPVRFWYLSGSLREC